MSSIKKWIVNDNATLLYQLVVSATAGIIFSPWSYGLVYYIIFIIVWEILYGLCHYYSSNEWSPFERLGIIFAGFLGWIVGRYLVGLGPFTTQREEFFKF